MKKLSGAKIAFVMFSAMTVACVSGSIGGTLAWYAYSTRALVSYSGTSVNETALLQIGICSDEPLTGMPAGISSVTFAGDSNYYYFANPGKGMTYDVIAKYLAKKGYATNELEPTTSGYYTTGMDESSFSLKQSPNELVNGNTIEAYKKDYATIPFVFRIEANDPGTYYDGKELWLSNAIARAASSGDGEVYKALRVFVDRDSRNYDDGDFILNPSAANKGQTRVGGVMNRSRNGYYDYNNSGEILYGEYDAAALDLISASGYTGADVVSDVNGVGNNTPSTFVAKHNPGTKYYSNLSSHDNLFKHAEYESLSSIAPERDSQDNLSNVDPDHPTSVCKTRADDHHLGRVNLTVYLEGWDFSVVDKEISHGFDLGLSFEMSRL